MSETSNDKTKGAFSAIQSKRQRPWHGEEEVRIAWVAALEAATGLHFDAERTKKDSSYNHVIIEFKAPSLFKGSKASAKFKEATEKRLLPYIQREAGKTGIPEDDFIGIAIDGEHICFAQVKSGVIQTQHLVPFSEYAVELVVQALQADTRRAITIDNLMSDFGHGSLNARALMQALGSPWAVLSKGRYKVLQGLSGVCSWVEGRKGITTDLNGVYFVPILQCKNGQLQVESRPDAGKKDIGPARTAWVEPDLLYPLVKGAGDFESCYLRLDNPSRTEAELFTFVPNRGIGDADYTAAESALNGTGLKKTKAWFTRFKALLQARSTYRRQMPGAPFYAVYNVGTYTFQPWKVIWPEMSTRFYAAVAGSAQVPVAGQRPYVPDHKVYFAGFNNKEPAYFLCGLLNAPTVREWVESHNISIQVGDVFKHMRLPEYDSGDAAHTTLAKLVEQAHAEHDSTLRASLVRQVEGQGNAILTAWLKSKPKK